MPQLEEAAGLTYILAIRNRALSHSVVLKSAPILGLLTESIEVSITFYIL
jgi:hypothetical protein